MQDGAGWLLVSGYWLLVWLLVSGFWLLASGYWLWAAPLVI
jgi:hypothetical protein